MSEYQCYEFVALDRPLSAKQMAELRAISTRAEISATRFWNEYHWGDLKADPAKLLERYFDAHMYFANWGTRRLMLRIPKARVDVKSLKPFFRGGAMGLKTTATHAILDLCNDDEQSDYDEEQYSLTSMSAARAELMRGDLRPAYLAWLLGVEIGDVDEDATEPPVPAGLSTLTAAQQAMIEFLRIDRDLVAAAADASSATRDDRVPLRHWLTKLSVKEKDAWLGRAVENPDLALGGEMLRALRATAKAERSGGRRTVGELRALAEIKATEREQAEAARMRRAKAAAEAERQRRLARLSRDVEAAWGRLEKLVSSSSYDEAFTLAVDLREIAARDGLAASFERRFEGMRKRQQRRRGFFTRWRRADEYGRPW